MHITHRLDKETGNYVYIVTVTQEDVDAVDNVDIFINKRSWASVRSFLIELSKIAETLEGIKADTEKVDRYAWHRISEI